jgi:CRP-like cAMP-binding protein
VRLPQEELARLPGATRESVGKVFKAWERQGLVRLGYGRVIRNRDGLAAIVDAALGSAG